MDKECAFCPHSAKLSAEHLCHPADELGGELAQVVVGVKIGEAHPFRMAHRSEIGMLRPGKIFS